MSPWSREAVEKRPRWNVHPWNSVVETSRKVSAVSRTGSLPSTGSAVVRVPVPVDTGPFKFKASEQHCMLLLGSVTTRTLRRTLLGTGTDISKGRARLGGTVFSIPMHACNEAEFFTVWCVIASFLVCTFPFLLLLCGTRESTGTLHQPHNLFVLRPRHRLLFDLHETFLRSPIVYFN